MKFYEQCKQYFIEDLEECLLSDQIIHSIDLVNDYSIELIESALEYPKDVKTFNDFRQSLLSRNLTKEERAKVNRELLFSEQFRNMIVSYFLANCFCIGGENYNSLDRNVKDKILKYEYSNIQDKLFSYMAPEFDKIIKADFEYYSKNIAPTTITIMILSEGNKNIDEAVQFKVLQHLEQTPQSCTLKNVYTNKTVREVLNKQFKDQERMAVLINKFLLDIGAEEVIYLPTNKH